MHNVQWQTKPDFYYRHIDYKSKSSNCGDIFEIENFDKYSHHKIFTMFRKPADRLLSEYHFLKNRPEFFGLLKKKPSNFLEYCEMEQTQNYCTKFLLGKRIFDPSVISNVEFDKVASSIANLPIYIGLFEQYQKSLHYFSRTVGVEWQETMDKKRITLNRPSITSLNEDLISKIEENNSLDLQLYLNAEKTLANFNLPEGKEIFFTGDRYNYVMIFVQRFNLLEIDLKHTRFITRHASFFKQLNKKLFVSSVNGRQYVELWNKAFIEACVKAYPDTILLKKINAIKIEDPIEKTLAISNVIDAVFEDNLDPDKTNYSKKLTLTE